MEHRGTGAHAPGRPARRGRGVRIAGILSAASLAAGALTATAGTAMASTAPVISLSQSSPQGVVGEEHTITATITAGGSPVPPGSTLNFAAGGGAYADGEIYVGLAPSTGGGYWLAAADGTILPEGGAPDLGGSTPDSSGVVAIASTPDHGGYFTVTLDGQVSAHGDAVFRGDTSQVQLNSPIIGIAAAADDAYWLLAEDGGLFNFGTAAGFYGSLGATIGADYTVGIVPSSDGNGYTICTGSGYCKPFGDAPALGDFTSSSGSNPLVSIADTPNAGGLWGLHADYTVSTLGSTPGTCAGNQGNSPAIAVSLDTGGSCWVMGLDGRVSGNRVTPGDPWIVPIQGTTATLNITSYSGSPTFEGVASYSGGAFSTNPNPLTFKTLWSVPPGYWMTATDGGVFQFGTAKFYGSTGAVKLNKPVVGMASTPDGAGYWLVATDGGIFQFGDAPFYGSTGAVHLNKPIVGMAATPDGGGYWLVASDGGIFQFGDAGFHGSLGAIKLNQPIVGMAATPDGGGYWLVAADGGVFNFGDAPFYGSAAGSAGPYHYVSIDPTPDGSGYGIVRSDGMVYSLRTAPAGFTPPPLNAPIVGSTITPDGNGYWLGGSDGGLFNYGTALFAGSLGAIKLNKPIVGIAAYPFPLLPELSGASAGDGHHSLTEAQMNRLLFDRKVAWSQA